MFNFLLRLNFEYNCGLCQVCSALWPLNVIISLVTKHFAIVVCLDVRGRYIMMVWYARQFVIVNLLMVWIGCKTRCNGSERVVYIFRG